MRYANYFQPLKTDAARGIKNIEKFDHKLLRMSTNERERDKKKEKKRWHENGSYAEFPRMPWRIAGLPLRRTQGNHHTTYVIQRKCLCKLREGQPKSHLHTGVRRAYIRHGRHPSIILHHRILHLSPVFCIRAHSLI